MMRNIELEEEKKTNEYKEDHCYQFSIYFQTLSYIFKKIFINLVCYASLHVNVYPS